MDVLLALVGIFIIFALAVAVMYGVVMWIMQWRKKQRAFAELPLATRPLDEDESFEVGGLQDDGADDLLEEVGPPPTMLEKEDDPTT